MEEIASPETEVPQAASPASSTPQNNAVRWTPKGKKLALERGLDLLSITDIVGTGPGGRVTGDDVQNYRGSVSSTTSEPAGPAKANKDTETVCVAGIGYAVPKNARSNEEILKEFPGKTAEEIEKVTGIKQRYVISEGESATSLAVEATNKALEMAGLPVSELSLIHI